MLFLTGLAGVVHLADSLNTEIPEVKEYCLPMTVTPSMALLKAIKRHKLQVPSEIMRTIQCWDTTLNAVIESFTCGMEDREFDQNVYSFQKDYVLSIERIKKMERGIQSSFII